MHDLDDPTQVKHFNAPLPSLVVEGVVLQLADGTIVACNEKAEQLLGLTTEQIKGWASTHSPWQAIHSDGTDFPGETHPATIALLTGQPQFNVVMGLYHPDGNLIWLTVDAQPLFQVSGETIYGVISRFRQISPEQKGQVLGANAMVQEITSRFQAEKLLRESQAQVMQQLAEIEAIYQSAPIGLNVLDTDLRFVRINQRLAEINGFPVEAHIGRTVRELLPEIADTAEQLLRPILETGEPLFNIEIQGETPAQPGVQRTWLEHFLPLKNGDRVIGISTVCEEITSRKQAEAQLQDQQERLHAALFAAETGTFRWDIRTSALDWDENLDRLFGLPSGQTAPSLDAFIQMVHPDDRQGVIDRCYRCATQGADFEMDFRVVYPDGSIRWLSDKGKTFFDGNGSPVYMTGACVDITDRKAIEVQREQLLQQEQAARSAAERANRIKDEFLAVLSHELRSPLNPILGWAKLLQTGKLPAAKTREALAIIERNAKLQSQLIEDLLDVSRILRGKLTLNEAPVDIAFTIKAALETVRLAAEAKNITISVSLGEVRPIIGDGGRLQQVIWNILTNAIKFTPENGRIEVSLTQVSSHVQIQVRDTGKGINPEFLPYVFEHFRQEDGAITRKFGGLGLGLAIVRQIVEMHGGTVQADSPGLGLGATFTVTLPLPKQTLPTPSQDSRSVSMAQSGTLAGIRVLVVDDDTDSRNFIAFVLEQAGASVVQTSSAISGLQILAESRFDILVSDIGMPQIDGYTFMRLLRAKPISNGGQIPAIALTAYAGELDQRQAIAAGFQRHLAKPVDPEQLAEAVVSLATKL